MAFMSKLAPDSATQVGILTAVGVYLIYNNALPSIADIRQAPPHDGDVESARKAAAWKSAALIGLVFLVARDFNSYIISGAALVGLDYMYKHHNTVNPGTGKVDANTGGATVYAMPDYGT
jgi:hypothetical protein